MTASAVVSSAAVALLVGGSALVVRRSSGRARVLGLAAVVAVAVALGWIGWLIGTSAAEPATQTRPPVDQAAWKRVPLPHPLRGEFQTAAVEAADAVWYGGGYLVVGHWHAHCFSWPDDPAPVGCDAALQALPAETAAAVWQSDDALSWELVPFEPSFAGSAMDGIATDGTRLVATGYVFGNGDDDTPAAWTSEDGITWDRVDPDGIVPRRVTWTRSGFVGVRDAAGGPQFLASPDGRDWRVVAEPSAPGWGEIEELVAGLDGRTVVAVGLIMRDGEPEGTWPMNWVTADGVSWGRGGGAAADGQWLMMAGAVDTADGWIAVGSENDLPGGSRMVDAIWRSPDGGTWTRVDARLRGLPTREHFIDIAWTGSALVATAPGSAWISEDGSSWRELPDGPTRLVGFDGWVLGLSVEEAPGIDTPTVWLAAP